MKNNTPIPEPSTQQEKDSPTDQNPKKKRFFSRSIKRWHIISVSVVVLFVVVRSSILDWSIVSSASMVPNVLIGDVILKDKLAYDIQFPFISKKISLNDPQRGDIALFKSPLDSTTFVIRIIGIPGDQVMMWDGSLFINGRAISYTPISGEQFTGLDPEVIDYSTFALESLTDKPHAVMHFDGSPPELNNLPANTVPPGKYIVLGDNRDFLKDSRTFGFVDRSGIMGKATRILFSFSQQQDEILRSDRFLQKL